VSIVAERQDDYICLTDIARYKNADASDDLIRNLASATATRSSPGIWERLNNAGFNPVEFDGIRMQAGLNSFALTPKQWIERDARRRHHLEDGRYGGTYAHKDIAFEFASWISVEFKLYLIKEFQRLKEDESRRLSPRVESQPHALEAQLPHPHRRHQFAPHPARGDARADGDDLRERGRFAECRALRPHRPPVARCEPETRWQHARHATIEQLLVLANLESLNAEFIHMALPSGERLTKLNGIAIRQMRTLTASAARLLETSREKSQLPITDSAAFTCRRATRDFKSRAAGP